MTPQLNLRNGAVSAKKQALKDDMATHPGEDVDVGVDEGGIPAVLQGG